MKLKNVLLLLSHKASEYIGRKRKKFINDLD